MRLGAFDYIEKPCKLVEIEAILLKIVERRKLKHKNIALQNAHPGGRGTEPADRRIAGHADGPAADRHDCPDRRDGPDPGRDGHGQGRGRPDHLPAQQAGRHAVRAGELRGPVADAGREPALRPPQGGIHRGRPRPQGLLRGRQRRHPVPRRTGRAGQEHPGQVAALPGVRRAPPDRRHGAAPVGRAGDLRDQPRPAEDDRRGGLPRGPALPAQHVRDPPAAACASARPTSRRWQGTCWPARRSGRWTRWRGC